MASTLREYFGPQLVDYRFWNSSCLKSASLSPACRMQAGTEDSVLFTEVPERQEGETGGFPYTSFPVLLSSDLGELARGQGPGEPPPASFPLPPAPQGRPRNLLAPPPPSGPEVTDSFFLPLQLRSPPLSPGFAAAQWFGSSQIP